MTVRKATFIGILAIFIWSTIIGFLRVVTEGLGAVGGAAMIYTLSSVVLLFVIRFPKLHDIPRSYLIWGSILFVSYEISLSLSVGFATSAEQAIEVSMVNYLWPSLTLLFAVIADRKRPSLIMFLGLLMCIAGVCNVLGGQGGFSIQAMWAHILSNPLSYILAFCGAVIWSIYCVVTKKIAQGSNCITLFFMLTALSLWIKYSLDGGGAVFDFDSRIVVNLILVSLAMGLGYAAWNVGILYGNVKLLATASYSTPVFSAFFAALILKETLSAHFWIGALMVCGGSLVCWYSTRQRKNVQ